MPASGTSDGTDDDVDRVRRFVDRHRPDRAALDRFLSLDDRSRDLAARGPAAPGVGADWPGGRRDGR